MISTLLISIPIAVTGTSHVSAAMSLESGKRVIGWDFTTPTYTNDVTTTLSVMSVTGNTLVSGSAIARTTGSTKLCTEAEKAPVFSGSYLKATVSGVTGGATAYTMGVILYIEDVLSGQVSIPVSMVNAMSFAMQPDALLDQAAPVKDTWYTVLQAYDAKLFGIGIQVDTTTETLGVRITVDGVILTGSLSCTNDTKYKVTLQTYPTGTVLVPTTSTLITSNQIEGRNLKVEVRKTTEAGTGNLKTCVTYVTRG